jgi:hypothetical protein
VGDRSSLPVKVEGLGRVAQLAASRRHTCALASDATVSCWGDGVGVHKIEGLKIVTAIASGGDAACALTGAGDTFCWQKDGVPKAGPRGLDGISVGAKSACGFKRGATQVVCWEPSASISPSKTRAAPGKVTSVWGDYERGCAQVEGGAASCWGGATEPAARVASGEGHACSVQSDRSVACWGKGDDGQIGNGAFVDVGAPATVLAPSPR